jgi:hypothetical protein
MARIHGVSLINCRPRHDIEVKLGLRQAQCRALLAVRRRKFRIDQITLRMDAQAQR